MPELPDVELYVERLAQRVVGRELSGVVLAKPFALRTVEPRLADLVGRRIVSVRRSGKRIVLSTEGELHLVVHLMIAGRLRWREPGKKSPGRSVVAHFDFEPGTLYLTEAGSKRRAALHVLDGREAWRALDRGGVELEECSLAQFAAVLRAENHTLKRALTDPRLVSGVGNAYSDEILHRAGLSPVTLTERLDDGRIAHLFAAAREVLAEARESLRAELGPEAFPEKVTAFRPEMAVHGRFGRPCPRCGTAVQRIRYAQNETNYCPVCQTEGRLLADRSLSRLLRGDWPRTLEELEERKARARDSRAQD